ncbi:sugar-phosphatase [Gottschalkiaceae bacterium SANA]|nr:sugar-phosphatase [Gottschalkiaceae bacterium SANA]
MIKFLALDVDGTLLNSKREVCESTIEMIKEAQEKDVLVTICTGRPVQGAVPFVKMFGLQSPIIAYNGGMIVDSKTMEVLYEQDVSGEDARRIIALGQERETTIIIWSNNQLYVNELNDHVNEYKQLSDVQPIKIQDYEEIIQQGITKLLWIDDVEKIRTYKADMHTQLQETVNVVISKPHYLEFVDKKVSKGEALKQIGEIYGISRNEMMAIGDGDNDLPMLEYAGLGVAMGNAPDFVKEKVQFVTASNDEDGIAVAIRKFIVTVER